MIKQEDIADKFKNRDYDERTKPTGDNFRWVGNPYGVIAKIAAALLAEASATPVELAMERNFSPLFKEPFYATLDHQLPYIKIVYENKMNQPLRWSLLSQRVHKMYYSHKGKKGSGRGGFSKEHYTNSEVLKPYVAAVSKRIRNYEIFTQQICDEIIKEVEGTFL